MKSTITLLSVVVFLIVLAAKESQAQKGCQAYGHACYGGHGKRSLRSLVTGSNKNALEQDDIHPEAIVQVFPNEASINADGEINAFPRYHLIKIMKSWIGGHSKRPTDRLSDIEYPTSGESFNRDNIAFN